MGSLEAIGETIDVEAEHATTTGDEADMPAETMRGAPWMVSCQRFVKELGCRLQACFLAG